MNAVLKLPLLENCDYDIVTSRNISEEMRSDPFNLGKSVKGLAFMSHEQALSDYALELVDSYAKFKEDHYELDLDKLSSPCQLELARLYIESIDREIEFACYGDDESINSDFLCALLAMLKDSNPRTRTVFAQVTTTNVLKYYRTTLQKILDTACDEFYGNSMSEAGYRQSQDLKHDDYSWSKR